MDDEETSQRDVSVALQPVPMEQQVEQSTSLPMLYRNESVELSKKEAFL